VFYVLYFNLFILSLNILFSMLYKGASLHDRSRTCMYRICSKFMRHSFGNDASHMNLCDTWFLNCPAYFKQFENGDRCVLSGVCLCVFRS
jgi:hypothetical protein